MMFFVIAVSVSVGMFFGFFVGREEKYHDYEDRIADLEARNQEGMNEAQRMINRNDSKNRGLMLANAALSRRNERLNNEISRLRTLKSSPLNPDRQIAPEVEMIPVHDESFVLEVCRG